MTTPQSLPPEPTKEADLDDIQADIERTREQLGETVEALTDKFDVKGRAKHKAQDAKQAVVDGAQTAKARGADAAAKAKDAATDDEGNVKPVVPGAAIATAALVAVVIYLVWRRSQ
jgi:Protein of unknown function (DUF3618)